jgi:hypothetical protein
MPRDDRERNFEKALARNLRANAPARPLSDTAPAPASHSVSASDCPDAEILAAYHERLLAPEEMISRKAHVASCLRCQEILAQLDATDEIPLEAEQRELQPKSAIAVPQMQLVHAARASASPAAREAMAKSDVQADVPYRPADRRWLILSGAVAAALLVWVAIHESAPQPFQMAKNQQQPVPQVSSPAPAPPADLAKDKSAEKELQVPLAAKNGASAKTDALALDRRTLQEQKALPPSPEPRLAAPRGNFQAGSSGAAAAGRAGTASRGAAVAPAQGKQLARAAAVPAPASATPTPGDSVMDSVDETAVTVAPAPQGAKKDAAVGGLVAAPRLTQSQTARAGAAAFREASNLASKLVQVSSPDGTAIWRLGPSGLLQRSDDSGGHWTLQKTATVADLLAGSAPSSKVCWIAGRDGTVLRTIDGGQHWLKVSSPTAEDVATVFAVDSQQATITTPTNLSYKTIDGGNSWTLLLVP